MKKILVIKHGSLGDIISATSALKDIRDYYFDSQISILTNNNYKNLFLESKLVNCVIIDNREGIRTSLMLIRKILKLKFDLIVDLQNSSRTSFYKFLFRLFSRNKINGTGLFCTSRYINKSPYSESVIEGLSKKKEKLGISPKRKPFLKWMLDENFKWLAIDNKKYFIINPGCSTKNIQKKWSKENYTHICSFLVSKNILPVVIGFDQDGESIDYIAKNEENILNLYNKSPLNLIYQLSQNAIGALSNDTGPAHLIAASGCNIHLILSSFSNTRTVIAKGKNVSFTQKNFINDIQSEEIIKKITSIYKL